MGDQEKEPKILVLDDDVELRDLIQFQLEDIGCEVDSGGNAAEGLKLLRENKYDLLVSDIRMPGEMDGIDMVLLFRKECPTQKVIFVTGFASEEKLDAALKQANTDIIKKPFLMDDLQAAVRDMISAAE